MAELHRRTVLRGAAALAVTAVIGPLSGCSTEADDAADVDATGSTSTAISTSTSGPPSPTSPAPASETTGSEASPANRTPAIGSRVLLAYFSRAGENYFHGDRIWLELGISEVVAETIQAAIPVDVYRIEAADPYPDDYEATVDRNVDEQRADARPAIVNPLPDTAGYDTVLLGSPIWNVRPPMIMRTFLDGVDLTDVALHPFVTFAVSGLGRTIDDYTVLAPAATIGDALAVQGEAATGAGDDVAAWLRRIGLLTT